MYVEKSAAVILVLTSRKFLATEGGSDLPQTLFISEFVRQHLRISVELKV